jgi:hypothetical protein
MTKLSLALPKYEAAINGLHDEVHFTLHMQDEVLKLFPPVYVVHTGSTRLVSSPNILDKPPKPIKTKVSIDPSMFLETDILKFKDVILRWTLDLLRQQAEQTAEVSLDTGEAAGNSFTFDLNNQDYWDAYIELLEKAPYQPLGYKPLDPEIEKRVKEIPQTPEQRQRIKKIQQAKREEFLRTKRTRRLS